jgi:hypothetical protein
VGAQCRLESGPPPLGIGERSGPDNDASPAGQPHQRSVVRQLVGYGLGRPAGFCPDHSELHSASKLDDVIQWILRSESGGSTRLQGEDGFE